jgi:hypothetical protein
LGKFSILLAYLPLFRLTEFVPVGFVAIDEQQILHFSQASLPAHELVEREAYFRHPLKLIFLADETRQK